MKFLSVHKNTLLLIASIVWLAAGVNIARIGLEAYAAGHLTLLNIVLSAVVGIVFWTFIFGKLVVKHTARITGYEEERHFFLKMCIRDSIQGGPAKRQHGPTSRILLCRLPAPD